MTDYHDDLADARADYEAGLAESHEDRRAFEAEMAWEREHGPNLLAHLDLQPDEEDRWMADAEVTP